jgi:hypothetical protein
MTNAEAATKATDEFEIRGRTKNFKKILFIPLETRPSFSNFFDAARRRRRTCPCGGPGDRAPERCLALPMTMLLKWRMWL